MAVSFARSLGIVPFSPREDRFLQKKMNQCKQQNLTFFSGYQKLDKKRFGSSTNRGTYKDVILWRCSELEREQVIPLHVNFSGEHGSPCHLVTLYMFFRFIIASTNTFTRDSS